MSTTDGHTYLLNGCVFQGSILVSTFGKDSSVKMSFAVLKYCYSFEQQDIENCRTSICEGLTGVALLVQETVHSKI